MRLLLLLLLAGCGSNVCDSYAGQSCIALTVRGRTGATLTELRLRALDGFTLTDGRTPVPPRRFSLPVQLAILPGGRFAGSFVLSVDGLLEGAFAGEDQVHGALTAGQHLSLTATLETPGDSDAAAVLDLSVVDGASGEGESLPPFVPASCDLAGAPTDGGGLGIFNAQTVPPNSGDFWSVWASSSCDVFIATRNGTILHSTGFGQWTVQHAPGTLNDDLLDIWGSGPGNVYAVGRRGSPAQSLLLHDVDGVWREELVPGSDPQAFVGLTAIAGGAADDIFLLRDGNATLTGILHSTGDGNWTTLTRSFDTLYGGRMYSPGRGEVYLANLDNILHIKNGNIDYQTFTTTRTKASLTAVGGTGPTDLYAVGMFSPDGTAIHPFTLRSKGDGKWTEDASATTYDGLLSQVGGAPGNVYAVGDHGLILGHNGTNWFGVQSFTGQNLHGVSALLKDDVYVVGENHTVLHRP
jgi:hypothetical protein